MTCIVSYVVLLMHVNAVRTFILLCIIIYPAVTAFTDQYSLPNTFFDIGQL